MPLHATGLDDPASPGAAELARFARDGHVTLRGLLDVEQLADIEPALSARVAGHAAAARAWDERTTYERAFLQVMNLWREDETVRRLVFSARLASAAAALLGVDAVRLYHDQALYKEPSPGPGGHTPWHVDQYYWPLATDRTVTAWIPLVDVPDAMGPLSFASGSQRHLAHRDLEISDESERACAEGLERAGFGRHCEPFSRGDVSFHLGWTFHSAPPNRSDSVRKVMTVIYMDAEQRVAEPANEHQRADLAAWLPGLAPGDVAASALNPRLWPPARS